MEWLLTTHPGIFFIIFPVIFKATLLLFYKLANFSTSYFAFKRLSSTRRRDFPKKFSQRMIPTNSLYQLSLRKQRLGFY